MKEKHKLIDILSLFLFARSQKRTSSYANNASGSPLISCTTFLLFWHPLAAPSLRGIGAVVLKWSPCPKYVFTLSYIQNCVVCKGLAEETVNPAAASASLFFNGA